MTRIWIWALCLIVFACAKPSPLPDMQPGETGRVTKIIDGDGLVLDTGQSVRLISIEAPVLSPRDRAPDPHAGESARLLEDMALGRRVQLFYPGLTRDRYDRALAHVVTIDSAGPGIWLNRAMIENGAARVRLYNSTSARGLELLQIETKARSARKGLWTMPIYSVRDVESFDGTEKGYFIVKGILTETIDVAEDMQFAPACLRSFDGSSLLLRVHTDARSACGVAASSSAQARGWVSEGALSLRHPWHLQSPATD